MWLFCFYLSIVITFLALDFHIEHACALVVVYTCFYFYCTLCTITYNNNNNNNNNNSPYNNKILFSNALGAISAGVEMSSVSA